MLHERGVRLCGDDAPHGKAVGPCLGFTNSFRAFILGNPAKPRSNSTRTSPSPEVTAVHRVRRKTWIFSSISHASQTYVVHNSFGSAPLPKGSGPSLVPVGSYPYRRRARLAPDGREPRSRGGWPNDVTPSRCAESYQLPPVATSSKGFRFFLMGIRRRGLSLGRGAASH
jgi:hypothetical protein